MSVLTSSCLIAFHGHEVLTISTFQVHHVPLTLQIIYPYSMCCLDCRLRDTFHNLVEGLYEALGGFFFFWGIYRLDFFVQSLLRKLSLSLKQRQLRTYTFVLSIQDRKHLHKGRRGSENISKVLLNHLVSYKSKVINFRCIVFLKELINNIYRQKYHFNPYITSMQLYIYIYGKSFQPYLQNIFRLGVRVLICWNHNILYALLTIYCWHKCTFIPYVLTLFLFWSLNFYFTTFSP